MKNKTAVTLGAAILITFLGAAALHDMEELPAEIDPNLFAEYAEREETAEESEPVYTVTILADGKVFKIPATGTVEDALNKAGVTVRDSDLINIGLKEKLNANTSVTISRVDVTEEIRIEVIDYATQYKEDANLTLGKKVVVVDGEEGELEQVIRHKYVDGDLVESTLVSEEITEEPVDEVVALGTKENGWIEDMSISTLSVPDDFMLDDNYAPLSYSRVITGNACAYSAKPTAKTASGRTVKVGYVAVDPNVIPYGSELFIVSTDRKKVYGYAIAADTGTALMEGLIVADLFMASNADCRQWGKREVNVYVLN